MLQIWNTIVSNIPVQEVNTSTPFKQVDKIIVLLTSWDNRTGLRSNQSSVALNCSM